jgi:hypothetical protein
MKKTAFLWLVAILALPGCASVTLKPVDFSWSFESVLTTDAAGVATGEPKTIVFNANELFLAETKAATTGADKVVRVIRDVEGYYYMTSPGFKHVYIFEGADGELTLEKKVLISEEGMEKPFFNRRELGIELAANGQVYLLNKKGLVSGEKK